MRSNVGEAAIAVALVTADAGTVTVTVSSTEMSYAACASSVIVTTVSLVRSTPPTFCWSRTSVFQPVPSDPAESRPSMMSCRMASKVPPSATQVSLVSVMMTVSLPAAISASVAVETTVPLTAADGPSFVAAKVGEPTMALIPTTAVAGAVTVIVSSAVIRYPATAGIVTVTTVSLVRSTSLKSSAALTVTSQPFDSDCAESMPLMRAVVCELSWPMAASQVSLVRVTMMVFPPVTTSLSSTEDVIVPVTAAEMAAATRSNVGVATTGFGPCTADAGTVTVTVSSAEML